VIVLDTNVISEPLRHRPDPHVTAWLDAQYIETLYLTAISVAEVRYGIAVLPEGRRKRGLHDRFETDVLPLFAGRVLPFDESASEAYARIQSAGRAGGRTLSSMDALIAATCAAQSYALATRNVADFEAAPLDLINPWDG
jgi:predicted nucleic acid-binding protein